jgi:hypothetical protein
MRAKAGYKWISTSSLRPSLSLMTLITMAPMSPIALTLVTLMSPKMTLMGQIRRLPPVGFGFSGNWLMVENFELPM